MIAISLDYRSQGLSRRFLLTCAARTGMNLLSVCTRMERDTRADDLEERLVQFAIDIVKLVGDLPQNFQARHIAGQLLRSGTAAAPNYAEVRAAESRADFIHTLRIALKELNETAVWLRIVRGSFAIETDSLAKIVAENAELCRILLRRSKPRDGRSAMDIEN